MVEWRKRCKPRHIFLVAALTGLRGPRLASDLNILQTCSATSPAVFINHLPKTLADHVDLIRRNFLP
jgi:hypothetical protein